MTVSERISRTVSSVLQTSSLGDANDMLRDSPLDGLDFDLTGDPGGGMVGESIALAEVALCILWGGVNVSASFGKLGRRKWARFFGLCEWSNDT